ncbi:hypothetical protein BDA96_03G000900 [Sorghum bicolor]|jgi:hypothetical protein|uniref:Uncharacterized protein n=1 Tax=Sorghum bicolor TaxID=4558 RepID=A0A921RAE6_SORBI|nr:hypothetical protein BDA96_03G000900 [Sorghum bicolor]
MNRAKCALTLFNVKEGSFTSLVTALPVMLAYGNNTDISVAEECTSQPPLLPP